MTISRSFIDPSHALNVTPDNWVIALAQNTNTSFEQNHAFILIEGINQFGKLQMFRYDCYQDIKNPDKCEILIKQETSEINEGDALLRKMVNNEDILCRFWKIRKEHVSSLNDLVLEDQSNPEYYNDFGDVSTFPKLKAFTDLIPEDTKEVATNMLESSLIAGTGLALGTAMEANARLALGYLSSLPPEIKQGATECASDLINLAVGQSGPKYVKSAASKPGNNSFTWARNKLYSLNIEEISNSLPKKPLDLLYSKILNHIKDDTTPSVSQKI